MDGNRESKYPKSVSGEQCIGPCYEGNRIITHPITLDVLTDPKNFCPTNPFLKIDPVTNQRNILNYDRCYIPTQQNNSGTIDLDAQRQLMAPVFKFDSNYFLKVYYNIASFEDTVEWIDKNRNTPYRTTERVFNQTMLLHGDSFSIVDHRLVKYIDYVMNYNMPLIIRDTIGYISVENGDVVLTSPSNKTSYDKEDADIIADYIRAKFMGDSNISKFLSKFLRYNFKDLKSPEFTNLLVQRMIEYIQARIMATIDSK